MHRHPNVRLTNLRMVVMFIFFSHMKLTVFTENIFLGSLLTTIFVHHSSHTDILANMSRVFSLTTIDDRVLQPDPTRGRERVELCRVGSGAG